MDNQLLTPPDAQDLLPSADQDLLLADASTANQPTDDTTDLLPTTADNSSPSDASEVDLSPTESFVSEAKSETPISSTPAVVTTEQSTEAPPVYSATINALRKSVSLIESELRQVKELLFSLDSSAPNLNLTPKEGGANKGTVVEGVFDGEKMIASDGTVYNVPPNYASKSKLLEGDILKLTITFNGGMLFKQVKPIERKALIATLAEDEAGNFWAVVGTRRWRLLTASVTYYKGNAGDEVAILVPKEGDSRWAAVEYVRIKN